MRCCKGKFNRFKFGNIAIGFGNLRKTNDTGRGLRVRFNGVGSLFGQLAGSLRDFSADFVGSGSFSADLSNIKQLDASIAGQGTLTGDLADFVGLLDDYSGAAAAYSVRLLSSTYSGALVRIRKDTGGQPEKDFYPDENGELSLDSEDGGNTRLGNWIGSNDGYVVTWYSQAGVSGRDATQSLAANQAQIVNGGSLISVNSKPALLANNSYYNISVPNYSIFSKLDVYKYANLPTSNETVYGLNDGGNNNRFEFRQDGADLEFFIRENGGSFVQPSIKTQDTNQNLATTYYDEGTINAYINSVLELNNYSTGLSDPLFNQLTLLATDANGIFFNLDGYIQESIFWGVDYSADNTDIESNVNDFFNIYS